jgi:hypothetical protein
MVVPTVIANCLQPIPVSSLASGTAAVRLDYLYCPGGWPWRLAYFVEEQMNRLKLFATCFGFLCSLMMLVGESQYELTMDATSQPSSPARGRGPFPGSALPGHSAGFPIRFDLIVPTGKLEANGTAVIDFVITNIGAEPIKLPSSADYKISHTHILTLYLTSDAIGDGLLGNGERMIAIIPTCAELYGQSGDPQTFHLLAPGKAIRVHASTRFRLKPGTHSLTAHAELLRLSGGRSELLGTAESISMQRVFSPATATAR